VLVQVGLGIPTLQLYAGVSSFDACFPVSSAVIKLDIKISSFEGVLN